jgi:Glyoxalase/Bleomycin resistance protein/Dioxygenase superfamily
MDLTSASFTQFAFVSTDWRRAAFHWIDVMGAGPFFILKLPPLEKQYRGRSVFDTFEVAISFVGNTSIEIIQPINEEPSMFREVLEKKGDGALHHMFPDFRAMDDEEYARRRKKYADLGMNIACEFAIPGLGQNIFYDSLDPVGTFVELSQLTPEGFRVCLSMYEAHRTWDGTNPIRDIADAATHMPAILAKS